MEDRRERVRWKDSCGEERRSGKQMERGQQVTYKRKWRVSPGMGKGRVKPRIAQRGCDPRGDSDECGSSDGWANLGPLCGVIRQRGVQDLSECSVWCHCPFITALLKPSWRSSIVVCVCVCVCVCVFPRYGRWGFRCSQSIRCNVLQEALINFPVVCVHNKKTFD